LVVGQEAGEWLAAERDGGPCGELGVAVLAHHEAAHVARVEAGLFADDGLETRGVERGAGTEHLGARQTGTFPGIPSHHVDRVGDHDDHAVKTGGHDVVDHFAHKTHGEAEFGHAVGVGRRLAAHGDDDDVRILAVGVVAGAHLDVAVLEFAAIIEVAGLPQGLGGGTVDEHKLIAQAVRDDAEGGGGTDLAGADDNDFVAVHSDHGDVLS